MGPCGLLTAQPRSQPTAGLKRGHTGVNESSDDPSFQLAVISTWSGDWGPAVTEQRRAARPAPPASVLGFDVAVSRCCAYPDGSVVPQPSVCDDGTSYAVSGRETGEILLGCGEAAWSRA